MIGDDEFEDHLPGSMAFTSNSTYGSSPPKTVSLKTPDKMAEVNPGGMLEASNDFSDSSCSIGCLQLRPFNLTWSLVWQGADGPCVREFVVSTPLVRCCLGVDSVAPQWWFTASGASVDWNRQLKKAPTPTPEAMLKSRVWLRSTVIVNGPACLG